MKTRFYVFLILLFGFQSESWCQGVKADLAFGRDSFRVGEMVPLHLSIRHRATDVVGFPDVKRSFGVFEVVLTTYKRTHTVAGISSDSVTYQVRCFELAPKLTLELPYFVVANGDTNWHTTPSRSIFLKAHIAGLQPQPPFLAHKEVIAIEAPPNYGLFSLVIGLCLIALLGLLAILRKPIRRLLKRLQLQREWQSLQKRLSKLSQMEDQPAGYLDELNHIWKDYLDPKASHALRSLTTTELTSQILQLEAINEQDAQALLACAQAGDNAIYAGQPIDLSSLKTHKTATQAVLETVLQYRLGKID